MKPIYLNNAATTWPKPPEVLEAFSRVLAAPACSPGRSTSSLAEGALSAERLLFEAREEAARFLGVGDSSRVVFTVNGTASLNLAILGTLRPGDRVVTTSADHNAVSRPLARAQDLLGVAVERVPTDPDGSLPAARILDRVTGGTRLVVLTHGGNVTGALQPLSEVAAGLSRLSPRPLLLVDAAQTAGIVPLDVDGGGIDLLATPGHKGLYGPPGTGLLALSPRALPLPLLEGGTGGNSSERRQPEALPDRLEAGTPNTPGIAALAEGIRFLRRTGVEEARRREGELCALLLGELSSLPGVRVVGPPAGEGRVGVVSFLVGDLDPAEVGTFLEETAGIVTRVGLHCAPHAHRSAGTFPAGTVRASLGLFNTPEEVSLLGESLRALLRLRGRLRG